MLCPHMTHNNITYKYQRWAKNKCLKLLNPLGEKWKLILHRKTTDKIKTKPFSHPGVQSHKQQSWPSPSTPASSYPVFRCNVQRPPLSWKCAASLPVLQQRCPLEGGAFTESTAALTFCVFVWENVENFWDTHLLQKILRPVKVLLVWWQWGAGAAEGSSVLEAEEVEEEEEEATEVEAKGPSPPSGCSSSGCWSMACWVSSTLCLSAASLTGSAGPGSAEQSSQGPSGTQPFWQLHLHSQVHRARAAHTGSAASAQLQLTAGSCSTHNTQAAPPC